jgi:probable HAF family extracellular repeat protein
MKRSFILCLILAMFCPVIANGGEPRYTFTDLGVVKPAPMMTSYTGLPFINDKGQILIEVDNSTYTEWRPDWYLYEAGSFRHLDSLVSFSANDMNESGQIAGSTYIDGVRCAVIYDMNSDSLTSLGSLGGQRDTISSTALGINDIGQAVGYSYISYEENHGFFWRDQEEGMVDLGDFTPYAINNAGIMAGRKSDRASVWDDGLMTDILPGRTGLVRAINNKNQVAGEFVLDEWGHEWGRYAFLYDYDKGELTYLPSMGELGSSRHWNIPWAINEAGQIVGHSDVKVGTELDWYEDCPSGWVWDSGEYCDEEGNCWEWWAEDPYCEVETVWVEYERDVIEQRPMLYQNGVGYNLDELVGDPDFILLSAYDINNSGQIVGISQIGFGWNMTLNAFLLTPVEEPPFIDAPVEPPINDSLPVSPPDALPIGTDTDDRITVSTAGGGGSCFISTVGDKPEFYPDYSIMGLVGFGLLVSFSLRSVSRRRGRLA